MSNLRPLFLIIITFSALLAPHFADARAGGGRSSMGSRGSRTYNSPSYSSNAQPIQRSTMSPQNTPQQQMPGSARPGFNSQPMGAAFGGGGSPFFRGLAGGFLGAGLASMFFGHSSYAGAAGMGGGGFAGLLGSLFKIILIGGLIYLVIRFFRSRSTLTNLTNATPTNNFSGNFNSSNHSSYQAPEAVISLNITDSDKNYFEQLFQKIQHHWSEGDLNRLRQFVTPELLQYFSEELSSNASRGLMNKVENVTLKIADITESWHEFDLDYASANLQWTAHDYMVNLDKNNGENGYLASGSQNELVEVKEVWTFVRSAGGNWLLSAVQQTG